MGYEVRAQKPVLVQPSSLKADSHVQPYFLSNVDQSMVSLVPYFIFVFDAAASARSLHHTFHPAKLLKDALGKVLLHFYPLAGRLGISAADGKLFVECNGKGVLFVEADANVKLSWFGDFSVLPHDMATFGPLVFPLPNTEDRPLLSAQVTRFKCGGFVLGLVFQHCLLDAAAAVEFLSAWGEIARGLPLSTPLVLDRTLLAARTPLQISYPHTEFVSIRDAASTRYDDAIIRSFCFSPASLDTLRNKALEDGMLSRCTVFEALSGLIWKARTEALWSGYPEQLVKLLIVVNMRSKVLPKGYVGNGLVLVSALASAQELGGSPLSHAVKRVQDVVRGVTEEYMRSQIDYMERHKLGMPPVEAGLAISAWSKMSFSKVDFGWGKPRYVGPVTTPMVETAILLSYGADGKGVNVVLALPPKAMLKFEEILHPFINPKASSKL